MMAALPTAAALGAAVLVAALGGTGSHPSYHTATGTMTVYDAEAHALTVDSATGPAVYRVASDARAWLGHKRLPLRLLASHVGALVVLAWSEVDGVRTTHTVRLEDPRPARAQ
jgi:hypothetical protein